MVSGDRRTAWVMLGVAATLLLTACLGPAPGSAPRSTHSTSDFPPSPTARDNVFDETRAMIEAARNQPLPPGNYRVDVERLWLSTSDMWAIGVLFGYADEHVKVKAGSKVADPGFRIGVAGGDFAAQLSGTMKQTSSSERTQMNLVTMPGAPASLLVGEQQYHVPYKIMLPHYPGGYILLPQDRFVGASLTVTVSPAGPGTVQVALTPSFSKAAKDGSTLHLTEMTTTVLAPLGQPLLISSSNRSTNDVASTLFSRSSSQGEQQGVMVLTVTGG